MRDVKHVVRGEEVMAPTVANVGAQDGTRLEATADDAER
jgi:hypothetical protein